ncbi:hypothetical protein [Xenorhabdus cabanillasii]|uniref:Uncharacterized protein n=1 Tax=Xenorhabdus cabanillasii JM26 TaxID=1427517 RepID=W1J9U2_9GAMM|nr:hypothetical protein [Xenorhabdus cabanillasii]PHM76164.1 hypothetical protein Xcab_03298 [Xenorhabdus cabanillasii JM26]CDL86270.1 conserved hypothetical protein [Xenorhabdus cabanillasii JM26]
MVNRRIAYAYYDPNWNRSVHSIVQLVKTEVEPLDYHLEMKDHLFCPSCYEPLIRVPSDPAVAVMADGKEALFRHLPVEDPPFCFLRSGSVVGKRYNGEEEARQAVEDKQFIVVSGFMQERPENIFREVIDGKEEPSDTHFEDENGREVDVPVSRHNGQTFKLPSRITSVQSLCSNFMQNYYREIFVVNEQEDSKRYLLCDSLKNVNEINEVNNIPNFYFGEIETINKYNNHTTVWLKLNKPKPYADFRVRIWNRFAEPRGIVEGRAEGRIIMFYAPIEIIGRGYCTRELYWGEVALLPEQYRDFLINNYFRYR